MKLILLIFFLTLTKKTYCSSISNCLKKSQQKSACLCQLQKWGLIMGSFSDVGAETEGSLIYEARKVTFVGGQYNSDPLRPEIHIQATDGFTMQLINASFQIDLFQTYLINTVKVWVYDHHPFIRTWDIQVFIVDNSQSKFLVYDNTAASGLITIKFDETMVESIIVYNRGGNSLNQYLHIIRFQAFFAF